MSGRGASVATPLDRRRAAASHAPLRNAGLTPVLTVWLAWLALMASANLATPLYGLYAARFGFSSLVLTLIFATYAVVLVPTLILFGRLSDSWGRRPVMVAGLAAGCVGLGLFAAASGTTWLFAARACQGLAVGMIGGPATAALVELDSQPESQRPALLAGLAQTGGSGAGPVLAGVLAQWAPMPRQLVFLVVLVALAAGSIAVLRLPEAADEKRAPWRIQWPRVPAPMRSSFWRVSLTAGLLWGSAALFLSIVPSSVGFLLHTRDLAVLGALAALALGSSSLALTLARRRGTDPRQAQTRGLYLLALGLLVLIVAQPLHSLALLIVASLVAGAGHGLGIFGAQNELNDLAPTDRRGEVTAAFIGVIYCLVAASVVATGLLNLRVSLPTAVSAVAAFLSVVCLAAAAAGTGRR